jgi:hypothetical protein
MPEQNNLPAATEVPSQTPPGQGLDIQKIIQMIMQLISSPSGPEAPMGGMRVGSGPSSQPRPPMGMQS